jgi:ribonuclease R
MWDGKESVVEIMENDILAFLARYPNQLFKSKELERRLSLKTNEQHLAFKRALRALIDGGKIKRVHGGKYGHFELPQSITGLFKMTKQGFGTVSIEGQEDEISIPPRYRGMAVHGDTVEVALFAQSTKRIEKAQPREGEVVKIIKRGRVDLVGTLERSKNFYIVTPDDRKIARDVFVAVEHLNKAKPGEKVVVQIDSWGVGHLNPEGRVVEVLGRAGEVTAELQSVIREFRLPLHFPPEILQYTDQLPEGIPATEYARRLDLRKEICFTIDPEDAKDFDDAVSLTELPNGDYRLGVHIADVSYYVTEGSPLDQEALKRGTSVYFPNMVIPMIPERLSNILCSLRKTD